MAEIKNDPRAFSAALYEAQQGGLELEEAQKVVEILVEDGVTYGERRGFMVGVGSTFNFEPDVIAYIEDFKKNELKSLLVADPMIEGSGLPDPAFMAGHFGDYKPVLGELEVDGYSPNDVIQGTAGDCYYMASLSAIAQLRPDLLNERVKKNADGTFTFTLFQDVNGRREPQELTIDADLPFGRVESMKGKQLYATATDDRELWPALFEKAYAQLKGGYEAIGRGGELEDALATLLGVPVERRNAEGLTEESLVAWVDEKIAGEKPIVAATNKEGMTKMNILYDARHALTVLGTELQNGELRIVLRNPYGVGPGGDTEHNGVFSVSPGEFLLNFTHLAAVE
jgi:hypothetical protein